jgi:septation ring formation regulator EzrA
MSAQEYILEIVKTIGTFTLGVGGMGLFQQNRKRLENKKLSSEALETMQKAYDKFTEDALKNYQKITLELDDLRKRLFEVTEQLNLEMIKYDKLKQSYDKLKLEFDTYKEKHNNKK